MEPVTDEVVRAAERVRAGAEREEADAFDRRYALERRVEWALAALDEAGRALAQQWAEADRRDEADRRFEPEPDDPEPVSPRRPEAAPASDDDLPDDDLPTTWYR